MTVNDHEKSCVKGGASSGDTMTVSGLFPQESALRRRPAVVKKHTTHAAAVGIHVSKWKFPVTGG